MPEASARLTTSRQVNWQNFGWFRLSDVWRYRPNLGIRMYATVYAGFGLELEAAEPSERAPRSAPGFLEGGKNESARRLG